LSQSARLVADLRNPGFVMGSAAEVIGGAEQAAFCDLGTIPWLNAEQLLDIPPTQLIGLRRTDEAKDISRQLTNSEEAIG
jgi:hypothetical protein